MKKQLIIFFMIVIVLIAGTGISQKDSQYIEENTIFYSGVKGTDTLKAITPDTLKMYLRNQGFTDSVALDDSLATFLARLTVQIGDTTSILETRTIIRSDSLSTALRQAARDSAEQVWKDSLGQAIVVIPNDLTVHGNTTANNGLKILNEISLENGGSIKNPDSLVIADATGIKLANDTRVNGTLTADGDITTGDRIILPEGGYFESIGADTTAVVDAVFKATNKLAVQNGLYFGNGTSIVPSSATETVLSGATKFYLRSQAVINPYWSTSPTSTVIGDGAGKEGMSGANNVIMGNNSGKALTSGIRNTFIGFETNILTTIGSQNTSVGYMAGRSNSGGDNTFLGNLSGYSLGAGSANTFIGSKSGFANTTGASNVYIGYLAGSTATATQSNKLIIANSETNNLITGDFSTGIATINNVLTLTPIATANRPATPAEGMMYMDSTVDSLKIYINSKWFNINMTEE